MKKIQKRLPGNTYFVFDGTKRVLTKSELVVLNDLITYYEVVKFIPQEGLKVVWISDKAYVDFAFMNQLYNDRFEIYITLK
jgi:hypothetical protein